MKILIVLTYYRPHTSGLTIYAERLAKAFVQRGHQVTVLTSHYEKSLPYEENQAGVRIVRVPVFFRLSKGVIMPTFGRKASRLVAEHDVIHLHLPQFDAAGVALRGRLLHKPTVITYHCDLLMPPGVLSWAANQAVNLMNDLAALFTHRIITYTRDYGENSPYLRRHLDKLTVIQPPVDLPPAPEEAALDFARRHNPQNNQPVIGMAARFATEKGVEVLLEALPAVLAHYPNALVFFAGSYQGILGEEEYLRRLSPIIQQHEKNGNWRFLGNLNPAEMACFYKNIDVLVLPSLNSTESFGLVQIEAMINGKPVVASNLPGVRQPITVHRMGEIIPIGDAAALGQALLKILRQPSQYMQDPVHIRERYLPESVAMEYEKLFEIIKKEIG
ncbi:MAG: glycosyltransferase family 4 protein [Anaerolineaceae bacterium]|nr:glycosyltransferase family 4 protein [Anaerolineaceae bacterium]